VGRYHEIGLLESLFERAREGEGQVDLISGQAGIGKSRAVKVLYDRLALAPGQMLIFQCSPHERTSLLHPVAQSLRRAAGVDRHDTASACLDALPRRGSRSSW
jgi:predicted ATPase